jgi:signal transduction histidine kinase
MNAMDRARGLTQQLLTFAKGGEPMLETAELMPYVSQTVLFALSGSSVTASFSAPEHMRPCAFDKAQIGQAIDNIVLNAVQAMPGGGALEVCARDVSFGADEHSPLRKGDYVELSIKDGGVGIPRDVLPRIFDPFFTTKAAGHGQARGIRLHGQHLQALPGIRPG